VRSFRLREMSLALRSRISVTHDRMLRQASHQALNTECLCVPRVGCCSLQLARSGLPRPKGNDSGYRSLRAKLAWDFTVLIEPSIAR
jgi:hypothetical protein